MKEAARRIVGLVVVAGALLFAPGAASARTLVFAETWENGTDAWRTSLNNGSDCKGYPTCPFAPNMCAPTFPVALKENLIQVRDGDGDGGRDDKTCSGKYVNIPRAYAGHDAGNYFVTGGATQGGINYRNAQFPVALNDRLCMVAWVRAYDENGSEAGPYVGINYAGAHGIVDAGHNHCTHFVIGSMEADPVNYCAWRGNRVSYGPMTQVIQDGEWHRYKASFTVNASDVVDWRLYSPEFTDGTTWDTADKAIYGQPRLSLFGDPPERLDVAGQGAPPIQNGADFGDLYVFKADGAEDPCPTDAELDALPFASDHACGPGTMGCKSSVAGVPAGARTPAQPGNVSYRCRGCEAGFGAAAGPTTCPETTPFCVGGGPNGGACTACATDDGMAGDPATMCAAGAPMCRPDGACGKCAMNEDCIDDSVHPGPNCDVATGACFGCATDFGSADPNACRQAAPHCDTTWRTCGKCEWNDECAGSSAGPLCDPASGACGKCDGDMDVSTTAYRCAEWEAPTCNGSTGQCEKCTSDADCLNPPGRRLHSHAQCDENGMCLKGGIAPVPPPESGPDGAGGDGYHGADEDYSIGGCACTLAAGRGGASFGPLAAAAGALVIAVRRRRRRR